MALRREDAARIVQFCLAGNGWGTARREGDAHVLKLVVTSGDAAENHRFEADSFEGALAQAVSAGVLRAGCVEKQMAFLAAGSETATAGPSAPGHIPPGPESSMAAAALLVSSLVHEVQRERGISALYAASGGHRFGDELRRQWQPTDRRYQQLADHRRRHDAALPSGVVERLGRAEGLLRALATSRRRVEGLEVGAASLIEVYSRANAELLGALEELLAGFVDQPRRSSAIAWMALSHAKERTGLERAQLASAFQCDAYVEGQYEAVVGLVSSRHAYLHLFATAASTEGSASLAPRRSADSTAAIERMERIALDHPDGGFGIDPTVWFATITREIDLYSDMELAVRRNLAAAAAA